MRLVWPKLRILLFYTSLVQSGPQPTSADITEHSGTNLVYVRRVLGRLRDAGLLTSEKGHAGGWLLARAPEKVTMADVYLALGDSLVVSTVEADSPKCSVENALHRRAADVLEGVEHRIIQRLHETTIVEVPVN